MPSIRRASMLAMLFLFTQNAQAQQVTSDTATLREVVIQSTRVGENSPVPHQNLSKKEISDRNQGQDLPFLLRQMTNVVENSDAGTGIGYTGLRIRGSDATRINVTLNGIPLNDAESQGVFWVDLPDFAGSTDEVQIQRGVGSSTNGAGSFGATINLSTTRSNPEPYAKIAASFGTFSTKKTSLNLGTGQMKNGFSFDGRLSAIQSDGWVQRAASDLKSWFLTGAWVGAATSVRANMFAGHERTYQSWFGLPAQYVDNQALINFNAAGTERAGDPYRDQVDDYGQQHFQLILNHQFSENWRANLHFHRTDGAGFFEEYKAAQNLVDYKMPDFQVGDSVISQTDLVRRKWLDNRFQGATWAIFYQKNKLESTFGGGANRYDGQHFGEVIWAKFATAPDGERYYNDDALKTDVNFFWKTERDVRLGRAMIDVQYRRVDYRFTGFDENFLQIPTTVKFHFFNPKIGFSSKINEKQRIYAFAGVGNREPNRADFTESSPQSRPKSEKMLDYEVGWELKKSATNVSANAFFMDYFDQLAPTGRLNDVGAVTRVNVPRSYRAGFELTANSDFFKKRGVLLASMAISQNKIRRFSEYVDNWDTGGQTIIAHKNTDLALSPNLVATSEISWEFLQKPDNQSLIFIFSGKYVGQQFLDNTQNAARKLPAYGYLDARLRFSTKKWRGQTVTLLFSANNLFNKNYVSNGWTYAFQSQNYDPTPDNSYAKSESGGAYNLTGFFPQAGRHWLATLSFEF